MFSIAATIKHNGLVTQITSETGPDRTSLVVELIADNAPGGVTGWQDESGHNNHPVLSGAPIKVAAALNGHAVVETDGIDDIITLPVAPSEPFTIIAVIKQLGGSRGFGVFTARSWGAFGPGGNWGFYASGAPVENLGVLASEWGVLSQNLTSSSSYTSRINGGNAVTFTPSAGTVAQIQFGADGGDTSLGHIQVAHILLFNTALDTATREVWENDLGTLYGITLTP